MKMDKLCANYGPLIGYIDDVPYYDMPSAAALVNPRVKEHLRELGFGYRAAYLFDTAHQVMREKSGWLDSLRNPESPAFGKGARQAGVWKPQGRDGYTKAHQAMIGLRGVGDKVADCVCLFGLGWGEAVPVDTHVWQIAQRDYGFGKGKHKSLTKATYEAVANHFRNLWGKEAGWAHSVLFTADLRDFASQVKIEVVKTEIAVKNEEVYSTLSKSLVDSASFATPIKTIKREPSTPAVASVSRSTLDDSSGEDSFIPKREIKKEIKEESYASAVTSESSSAFDDSSDEDSFMPKQEIKKETKKEIKVEVKQEIQPDLSIRTKKRKATALIKKEEKINVKTEAAEDSGKRRRSGRLRR